MINKKRYNVLCLGFNYVYSFIWFGFLEIGMNS